MKTKIDVPVAFLSFDTLSLLASTIDPCEDLDEELAFEEEDIDALLEEFGF